MKLHLLSIFLLYTSIIQCRPRILHPKFRGSHADSIPLKYIIEFEPDTSPSFLDAIEGISIRRVYAHALFQGVSIEITNTENEDTILQSILDHPGIAFVSPNRAIQSNSVTISNSYNLSPDSIEKLLPHEIHQVDRVRKELGLTGNGIFVGIIDSGVDYTLPALGGGFGEGYKIAAGYDFVGQEDTTGTLPSKNDSDPMMTCGTWIGCHGTHIAGIIAGEDPDMKFEGVAPNATLGMWRALDCAGGGDLERLMQSAIAAFDAGVQIVSYSIGYPFPWTDLESPDYRVFKRMIEQGIFVVIAASNRGEFGAFTVDGLAQSSFSVASAVNKYKTTVLNIRATGIPGSINAIPTAYVNAADQNTSYVDGDLYIMSSNNSIETLDPCDFSNLTDDIEGKIVLIYTFCLPDGTLPRIEQHKPAGYLLFSISDVEDPTYVDTKSNIPIVRITKTNALRLVDSYIKNNGTVSIEFFKPEEEIEVTPFEKTISLYSSIGPTADLSFSPNIAAIGEMVYSTLPRQFGGYGIMSGTSMTAPYISGALALYLEYHGINKTKPEIVLAKFKNYALLTTTRENGTIENPLRQGAGLVQVYDSIIQTSYVLPPEISFKDSSFENMKTQNLTITNEGNDTVSYNIYNNVSTAMAPYNTSEPGSYTYIAPVENLAEKADIEFSETKVSLGPGESKSITVKVTPPNTNPLSYIMYGGYIQFSPDSGDHKTMHVPYFGVVGNRREIPIFNQDSFVFSYNGTTQNYSYTGEVQHPFEIVHILNSTEKRPFINIEYALFGLSRFIKAQVVNNDTQQVIGDTGYEIYTNTLTPTYNVYFNGCYYKPTGDMATDALGYTCSDVVKNGTYFIRVSALELFGNATNSNDYENWTSIPFTIQSV